MYEEHTCQGGMDHKHSVGGDEDVESHPAKAQVCVLWEDPACVH